MHQTVPVRLLSPSKPFTTFDCGSEHPRGIQRGRKQPPDPKFETLCTSLPELESIADNWRTARGRQQKMRKLGKYVDSFLPQLQAKDRAKKRAYEVALMPRRKSDRAQVLERKQMEGLNQTSPHPLQNL